MLIFIYNFFLKTKNLIYKVFIKENIYSINTVLLQNLFESATYLFIYTQWITHTTHTDRQIVEIDLFIYLFIYIQTEISHEKTTGNTQRITISLLFIHTPRIYGNSGNRKILEECKS